MTKTKPDPSQVVQVYKNLHKRMWSVRQGGRVVFHCNKLILKDCTFRVQPSGRKRVLKKGQKNVHAYVAGFLSNARECRSYEDGNYVPVSYDPYKNDSFIDAESGLPILTADFVDMDISQDEPVLAIWKKET
jgi:hypothetical protein